MFFNKLCLIIAAFVLLQTVVDASFIYSLFSSPTSPPSALSQEASHAKKTKFVIPSAPSSKKPTKLKEKPERKQSKVSKKVIKSCPIPKMPEKSAQQSEQKRYGAMADQIFSGMSNNSKLKTAPFVGPVAEKEDTKTAAQLKKETKAEKMSGRLKADSSEEKDFDKEFFEDCHSVNHDPVNAPILPFVVKRGKCEEDSDWVIRADDVMRAQKMTQLQILVGEQPDGSGIVVDQAGQAIFLEYALFIPKPHPNPGRYRHASSGSPSKIKPKLVFRRHSIPISPYFLSGKTTQEMAKRHPFIADHDPYCGEMLSQLCNDNQPGSNYFDRYLSKEKYILKAFLKYYNPPAPAPKPIFSMTNKNFEKVSERKKRLPEPAPNSSAMATSNSVPERQKIDSKENTLSF